MSDDSTDGMDSDLNTEQLDMQITINLIIKVRVNLNVITFN